MSHFNRNQSLKICTHQLSAEPHYLFDICTPKYFSPELGKAATLKIAVICFIPPGSLIYGYHSFEGTYYRHLLGIALKWRQQDPTKWLPPTKLQNFLIKKTAILISNTKKISALIQIKFAQRVTNIMKQLFNLSGLSRNRNSKAHGEMLQTT